MAKFEYDIKEKGESVTLFLSGGIKVEETNFIRPKFEELLLQGKYNEFIIDLSKVDYMGSSGFGFLIHAQRLAVKNEISLILKSPSKDLIKMLKAMSLDELFTISK